MLFIAINFTWEWIWWKTSYCHIDGFLGRFTIKMFIMSGIKGDDWIMNPVGGDGKVMISMTWSPLEDMKVRMICAFNIGKTENLPDVNLDDDDSYKVKFKFGFLDDDESLAGCCYDKEWGLGTMKNGTLLEDVNSLEELIVDNKFSLKAEVMIVPFIGVEKESSKVHCYFSGEYEVN